MCILGRTCIATFVTVPTITTWGKLPNGVRRARLCVFAVTSPTNKLPSVGDVETGPGGVSSVRQGTSVAAPVSSGAVQPAKAVASVSGSSDVAQRLKEKKGNQQGASRSRSSSKANSEGSGKRVSRE